MASCISRIPDRNGDLVTVNFWKGHPVSNFPSVADRLERTLKDFKTRQDDVFILNYSKCGTHWLHEICHFLLTGQTQERPPGKIKFMLEAQDLEVFEAMPEDSPRVLNCHLYFSQLPDAITRRSKVIHCVRNPKDVLVSLHHHVSSIACYGYSGTVAGFQKLFANGTIDGGSWFQHTREFKKLERDEKPKNVLFLEYEMMKAVPKKAVRDIHSFLFDGKAELTEEFLDEVVRRTSFASMHTDKKHDCSEIFKDALSEEKFYRKGKVGDWRNHLSQSQSAQLDRQFSREMAELQGFYQPIYDLPC